MLGIVCAYQDPEGPPGPLRPGPAREVRDVKQGTPLVVVAVVHARRWIALVRSEDGEVVGRPPGELRREVAEDGARRPLAEPLKDLAALGPAEREDDRAALEGAGQPADQGQELRAPRRELMGLVVVADVAQDLGHVTGVTGVQDAAKLVGELQKGVTLVRDEGRVMCLDRAEERGRGAIRRGHRARRQGQHKPQERRLAAIRQGRGDRADRRDVARVMDMGVHDEENERVRDHVGHHHEAAEHGREGAQHGGALDRFRPGLDRFKRDGAPLSVPGTGVPA
jgi:hypothetical protein